MDHIRQRLLRSFFKLVLFYAGMLAFLPTAAQPFEITGKVVNDETDDPIPFVSIGIKGIYKGTASNELGEFSFKVDSLPITLVFSHLSFNTREIVVTDDRFMSVRLTPGKLVMEEVVVKAKKGDPDFAYNLVLDAYDKIVYRARKEDHYGKAFYRQISKNGDVYSELYEIFFDTRFSRNGVEDWAIQEGRYALKLSEADSFIYNKNFTLMVRLLSVVQPQTDDLVMPVSKNVRDLYYLTLESIVSVNGRNAALIRFRKKETVEKPTMEGEMLIDLDSHDLLRIKGTIANDNLNFVKLKGKSGYWKNYKLSSEMAFKYLGDNLVMDYMRLWQNFDYFIDSTFINNVTTSSFFSYYEYYTPPKRKKLGGRLLRYNRSDAMMLDNLGYNQEFWDDNIIVKRTPVEAEVIASFEEERAFGSIYLNNRNQFILENYQLDKDPLIVRVRKQLKKYDITRYGEKVYLHHDKPMYLAGEKLWFRAYIVQLVTNLPVSEDDMLHITLTSPEGKNVLSSVFPVVRGKSYGELQLPDSLAGGVYMLKAYTEWMKNFDNDLYYHENLVILNPFEETPALAQRVKNTSNLITFTAEGGVMVDGIPSQIGFRAEDRFGNGINIKGRITDENGRLVAPVKTIFDGMGNVFMLPRVSVPYKINLNDPETELSNFPKVQPSGYSVMINNLKSNTIDVLVRGNARLEGKKFYILVISNGLLIDRRVGMLTKQVFRTEIPKTNLPPGFAQILLVDEFGHLFNKRIIYHNPPEEATVKIYQAKRSYDPREKVELVLELRDQDGKPLGNANISVSVLDKDKIIKPATGRNIRSYLNLEYQSDFHLESPVEILTGFDRETLKRLDLVALNQSKVVPEVQSFDSLQSIESIPIRFKRQSSLQGRAVNKNTGEPLMHGYLTILAEDRVWYAAADAEGMFSLNPPLTTGSDHVFVNALDKAGKSVKVDLEWLLDLSGEEKHWQTDRTEMPKRAINYIEKNNLMHQMVSAREINIERLGTAGKPDPDLIYKPDSRKRRHVNLLDLLGKELSGVSVNRQNDEKKIILEGSGTTALVILDGLILNFPELIKTPGKNNLELLKRLNSSELNSIEIYRYGKVMKFFDEEWEGGVVYIRTKEGYEKWSEIHGKIINEVQFPPLSPMTIFEGPEYAAKETPSGKVDGRSTIYWNPDITTNRRGRVKISFYNSDEAKNLQICIEGITPDGLPVFDIHFIGKDASLRLLRQ